MVIVAGLVFIFPGCHKGPGLPSPVSVTGKITLKGQPVDSANVSFTAISEGLPGDLRYVEGKTDASGEYTLANVYPAEYLVQVVKVDPSAAPADLEQAVADPSANSPFAAYGNESPLRAIVKPDATRFEFELSPKK